MKILMKSIYCRCQMWMWTFQNHCCEILVVSYVHQFWNKLKFFHFCIMLKPYFKFTVSGCLHFITSITDVYQHVIIVSKKGLNNFSDGLSNFYISSNMFSSAFRGDEKLISIWNIHAGFGYKTYHINNTTVRNKTGSVFFIFQYSIRRS